MIYIWGNASHDEFTKNYYLQKELLELIANVKSHLFINSVTKALRLANKNSVSMGQVK